MLFKTFKSRIFGVAISMTIVSILIFGYGLAGIYRDHMYKCLNRSLSFLNNMLTIEFDIKNYSDAMQKQMHAHPQLQNVLRGGLIYKIKIEMLQNEPLKQEGRIYQFVKLDDSRYFTVSSSSHKINEEVINMISDRWVFFLFGFMFTSFLIYFLVRLLFTPINQLVQHCLTCEDPDKLPRKVAGGTEISTLRDAIATLQRRISGLQKTQQETMKALTHELKTPLAQLRLRIDLANEQQKWTPESVQESKKEIDEISNKITKILHSQKVSTKVEPVELEKSLSRLRKELEPLWSHRELSFEVNITQQKSLKLPAEAFERVLRILIENSINHSKRGATIKINAKENLLKITNPISTDTNKIIDSTGKGLEIAKMLCEYYNWELEAKTTDAEYEIILNFL